MIRMTGMEAIAYAIEHEIELCKLPDDDEGARDDLDIEEARHIAQYEPSLIYIDIEDDEDDD